MTVTINTILNYLNEVAPFAQAESWDNNGLLIGSGNAEATSILVSLDPSMTVFNEAKELGCNTIITHHPIIFKPLPAIDIDTPTGKFIQAILTNSMNVIACHTNLDSAIDGVSDSLGRELGLVRMEPLLPKDIPGSGMGRIGKLPKPVSGKTFIKKLLDALSLHSVRIGGQIPDKVSTIALCGGSGSEIAPVTQNMGADIYITAEVKHSTARWAEETGFCIVDATHYSTEKFAVNLLCEKLTKGAEQNGWDIKTIQSKTERHPFAAVDKNSLAE